MKTLVTIDGISYYYTKFFQRKKNGKKREINSPCLELKAKQNHLKSILENEIEKILPTNVVGFRKKYDLKKNGQNHLGKKWVINLDVKNFFPSISKEILENELIVYKELLKSHGYLFNDFIELVILNKALPQGSPVSPLLSNFIGYKRIDTKVYPYLLSRFGTNFNYTRYADDLTISLDCLDEREEVKLLANEIINLVESDGLFFINKSKIKIMHRSEKQIVTGITVNQKVSLGKKEKLRYRAIFHKLKMNQLNMSAELQGKLSYLNSVDPDYYKKLQRSLKWK